MALPSGTGWFGVELSCPDAQELVGFYEELLGWQIFVNTPQHCTLAASEEAGYNLSFATDLHYERPVWPSEAGKQQMMLHLDFGVHDIGAATSHALKIGAELAAHQPQADVRVLLDPAGHPFCLYLDQ